jgi:hypothetical protein
MCSYAVRGRFMWLQVSLQGAADLSSRNHAIMPCLPRFHNIFTIHAKSSPDRQCLHSNFIVWNRDHNWTLVGICSWPNPILHYQRNPATKKRLMKKSMKSCHAGFACTVPFGHPSTPIWDMGTHIIGP